jgi:glutathione S-transferase
MSTMVVHGIIGSPYLRSALLAFEEKGAPYELAAMPFGGHNAPAHLARHPFGRIPVLEQDGWLLYETQAIMRYMDAVVPGPPLQPDDPREAARMNQVMGINDSYVMPQVGRPIGFPRLMAPRLGLPVDEDAIARAIPDARACIAEISRLLGDRGWFAGDAVSLADLLLAPQLSYLAKVPEGQAMLQEHGALRAWIARMEARPSMKATTPDALRQRAMASA